MDESRFKMYRNDGQVHVYQRKRERLPPNYIPYGGGAVMVWGGICGQRTTNSLGAQ